MIGIINFITDIITKAINVMNVKLFPDMNVTYIQLIFGCIVLGMIFKLCFGGFKEFENSSNLSLSLFKRNKQSKDITHHNRIMQINETHIISYSRRG